MPGISKHLSVCVLSLTLASAAFASRGTEPQARAYRGFLDAVCN